jgi:hypothetical protein
MHLITPIQYSCLSIESALVKIFANHILCVAIHQLNKTFFNLLSHQLLMNLDMLNVSNERLCSLIKIYNFDCHHIWQWVSIVKHQCSQKVMKATLLALLLVKLTYIQLLLNIAIKVLFLVIPTNSTISQ